TPNTSSNPHISGNIYHSDLTTLGLNSDDVIEYRVILDKGKDSRLKFYNEPEPPGNGMATRGIAVASDTNNFICSKPVTSEGDFGKTVEVADFFVKYGSGAGKFDGFNIAVVPKAGSTETPILI